MARFFKRTPVVAAPPQDSGPKHQIRDLWIGGIAFCFAAASLGFCSAGAYELLRDVYSPAVALFMIGGFYGAAAVLLILYLVLGGYEVARAAHAQASPDAQTTMLDGLTQQQADARQVDSRLDRSNSRTRAVSAIVLGTLAASVAAARRRTR